MKMVQNLELKSTTYLLWYCQEMRKRNWSLSVVKDSLSNELPLGMPILPLPESLPHLRFPFHLFLSRLIFCNETVRDGGPLVT